MIEANPAFKVLIYLASPYSDPNPDIISLRVEAVQDATARLIEAGHLVFSPIVHSHPIKDLVSFDPLNGGGALTGWMDFDKAFIDKADELWILRLPGHTRSKGVHAELYHALDQGKRVRYINYPDLTEYAAVEAVAVNAQGFPDVWEDEFKKEDYGKVNTFGKAFPGGPVYKVGDQVRILVDNPNHSPLKKDDVVTVTNADLWGGGNSLYVDDIWAVCNEYVEKIEECKLVIDHNGKPEEHEPCIDGKAFDYLYEKQATYKGSAYKELHPTIIEPDTPKTDVCRCEGNWVCSLHEGGVRV